MLYHGYQAAIDLFVRKAEKLFFPWPKFSYLADRKYDIDIYFGMPWHVVLLTAYMHGFACQ